LRHVQRRCHEAGVLLIFDEVISGFRVALGGMAELTGITPDLVTYGKVIGGGFPVGAYAGAQKYMDLVAPMGPVYQAGTLSANPVGMRAGLITLKKAERENIYSKLEARADKFCQRVQQVLQEAGHRFQVTRQGSIFWIHSGATTQLRSLKEIPSSHGEGFKRLFHACLENGVYLAPSGYEVGFIGYAHSEEILEQAVEGIRRAAQSVRPERP